MRNAVAIAFALLSTGCATVRVNGFTINEMDWERVEPVVRSRASFDLSCDERQLDLKLLAVGDTPYTSDKAMQIGVTGCGKKAVYVRAPAGWVANLP